MASSMGASVFPYSVRLYSVFDLHSELVAFQAVADLSRHAAVILLDKAGDSDYAA